MAVIHTAVLPHCSKWLRATPAGRIFAGSHRVLGEVGSGRSRPVGWPRSRYRARGTLPEFQRVAGLIPGPSYSASALRTPSKRALDEAEHVEYLTGRASGDKFGKRDVGNVVNFSTNLLISPLETLPKIAVVPAKAGTHGSLPPDRFHA